MSWNRCSGFLTVIPTYSWLSGHGRKLLSKWNRPTSFLTRRKVATSSKLGSVALRPTRRTIS